MLALLEAFTPDRHVWTVDKLAEHFAYTQSATYRYVRELCRSGLLVRMPNGEYVIGARVVELDSLIRDTAPLTKICTPVMKDSAGLLGCHALLSNVYGQHLINVAHVGGNQSVDIAFVRGRRLPWFSGSTSKSILAFMPRKRLVRLYEEYFEGEKSKDRWRRLLAELKQVSDTGYCISEGELQPDVMGIGAPIITGGEVVGSVSLVFSQRHGRFLDRRAIGEFLALECNKCGRSLEEQRSLST
ncbi:MAG: helix-turn-helix domain-containing protein [Hyphomicrobiales bacterium]|nr:helix-turn-helix domain-containing protein [Hyphomicrobiales bacterium]MCP5001730.1 helix-turn-helix domain-containing protein [Hyphomicrobiales bacterium]